MNEIALRALTDEDIPLLAAWLEQDYIKRWYGAPEDWLKELRARKGAYSFVTHQMVTMDTRPIGFCQYYDQRKI